MRPLIAIALAALTTNASAYYTYIDEVCSIRAGVPAEGLEHHDGYAGVCKALDVCAPADEAAAKKSICASAACKPWEPVGVADGTAFHLVIPDEKGGAWVVRDMGWIGGNSACNLGDPTGTRVADGLVLVRLDEKSGEWGGSEDAYCADEAFATSYLLLDVRAKLWLVIAANVGDRAEPKIAGDKVSVTACGGDVSLAATFDDIRAGKARVQGTPSEALRFVAEGRKLTAKKDYPTAAHFFMKAATASPDLAVAWSGLGYAKLLEGSDLEGARAAFMKALDADRRPAFQAQVWFNLGLLAEKKGDATGARAAFEKSHALRPTAATKAKLKVKP